MAETFRIIRQDNSGNRFIEYTGLNETLADKFVEAREKKIGDHHQTVWKQNMKDDAPWEHVPVPLPF